jgi:hypothetical protein
MGLLRQAFTGEQTDATRGSVGVAVVTVALPALALGASILRGDAAWILLTAVLTLWMLVRAVLTLRGRPHPVDEPPAGR